MKKCLAVALLLLAFIVPHCIWAQYSGLEAVLHEVEANNKELVAFRKLVESRTSELQKDNRLADPQAVFDYLLGTSSGAGTQKEFVISQSFDFPTAYSKRTALGEQKAEQFALEYRQLRQEILLTIAQLYYDLIALRKYSRLLQERYTQGQLVFEKAGAMFEAGQTSILERNKSRIVWLAIQFEREKNQIAQNSVEQKLAALNGGKPVSTEDADYPISLEIPSADTLWQNIEGRNPELLLVGKDIAVAEKEKELQQALALPGFSTGYHYQAAEGLHYSGIQLGISLPLWRGGIAVEAAELNYQYRQSRKEAVLGSAYQSFQEQYNRYTSLVQQYNTYRTALTGLQSEQLLREAFEVGELSFLQYYQEVLFYRDSYDAMLQMEHELFRLRAELLQHQL